MATIKVLGSQLLANPYRDLSAFSWIESKIAGLDDSAEVSKSFWENVLGRVEGNEPFDLEDGMLAFNPDTFEPLFMVEKAYGHHRFEMLNRRLAAGRLDNIKGVEVVETPDGPDYVVSMPIQSLDDATMLKIMANENKDDGTSPIIPLLETARQTEAIILEEVGKADSFAAYQEAGGTFFDSKPQFDALKKASKIGPKQVKSFLGETWSENDINNAMRCIRAIQDGLFEQDQVTNFPSAGMLKCFCAYAENVMAKEEWPEYFKRMTIDKMASTIVEDPKEPSEKPTVRTVTSAAKEVKGSDLDGTLIARKGATTRKWTPAIHIKQVLQDDPDLTDEQIIAQFGMEGDLIPAILKEGRKLYEQAQKKKESGAAEDGDAPSDDLDEQIADAAAETVGGDSLPVVTEDNVEVKISEFITAAQVCAALATGLAPLLKEEDLANPELIEAVSLLANGLNTLSDVVFAE